MALLLGILVAARGEQVCNPCSSLRVLMHSQSSLAPTLVSYDMDGSAAFGEH